ncbi:restriction endonuclease subunit S [Candidatus Fermentibacteria bacterium]|nr:restriction endonuclease subunit S [Candidatus Fermentibacteria bacterium]
MILSSVVPGGYTAVEPSSTLPAVDHMSDRDLPEGWARATLGALAQRITKGSTPTSYGFEYQTSGIRFVKVENLRDGRIDHSSLRHFISDEAHQAQSRSILREGDILFSIAGTLGQTCEVHPQDLPANTNQALAIVRGTGSSLDARFLRFVLSSEIARGVVAEQARGAGMNNISLADVAAIELPLPPLAEQRRIVEKVEELLAHVNAARDSLAKIPSILKRFRQSILSSACSGRLTEDWREADNADDIPSGWVWVTPTDLAEPVPNALTIGPFGSNLKVSDYQEAGVPLVFVRDIRAEAFGGPMTRFISREKARELSSHIVRPGDLLLTKMGEPPGDTAVYPAGRPDAVITADCIKLTPRREVATGAYLRFCFRAEPARAQIIEQTMGVAQQKLSLARFRQVRLPLPPLAEQHEIVRRVEALFAVVDAIENRVAQASARADRLTQSILAKAFRGDLVPTEASLARASSRPYESAAELLARMQSEHRTRMSSAPPSHDKSLLS